MAAENSIMCIPYNLLNYFHTDGSGGGDFTTGIPPRHGRLSSNHSEAGGNLFVGRFCLQFVKKGNKAKHNKTGYACIINGDIMFVLV